MKRPQTARKRYLAQSRLGGPVMDQGHQGVIDGK